MSQVSTNRVSTFPRSNRSRPPHTPKRALADQEPEAESEQSGQKLRKYIKSVPVRDLKPRGTTQLRREVSSPWDRYQEIFKMKQAGLGHFVHSKDDTFSEMIIKERKAVQSHAWLSKLSATSHKNIVPLREALYHNSSIYFVYEVLDVSLAQVFATPLGRLKTYEVAAFCYEVLAGIEHIHNDLRLVHGDINSENILLSTDGSIKIANIGTSMLKNIDHKEAQKDVFSLGRIMIECLEPSTSLGKGDTLKSDWDPALVNFQISTKTKAAHELLQDDFLKLSPGPRCLKPYIRLARELGTKQVEIVEGS